MRLGPDELLALYKQGLFPMADSQSSETIRLYSPDPRTIIPLDRFHVSKNLARRIRSNRYPVTFDKDFAGVIQACARPKTWLSPELAAVYQELHRLGRAHSVEAWHQGELVGGSYGVSIGAAFMAESMFHTMTDAGMVALAGLVEKLRADGFTLFDTQYTTPHLLRCGARELYREEYLARLEEAASLPDRWT